MPYSLVTLTLALNSNPFFNLTMFYDGNIDICYYAVSD